MHFPHCVVFFYYLPWFVDVYGNKSYYFKNATQCGKRMQKLDVATRLKGEAAILIRRVTRCDILMHFPLMSLPMRDQYIATNKEDK